MKGVKETCESELRHTLSNHNGKQLTPDLVEILVAELIAVVGEGLNIWAFEALARDIS